MKSWQKRIREQFGGGEGWIELDGVEIDIKSLKKFLKEVWEEGWQIGYKQGKENVEKDINRYVDTVRIKK